MQVNLENKKVLLTGASGGIGKALSQKFINSGANLIFTSSKIFFPISELFLSSDQSYDLYK